MRFRVRHCLEYSYSEPVWLEPLLIRLRPLCNQFQRIDHFTLRLNPEPAGSSPLIDAAGNCAQRVWFTEKHSKLKLEAMTEAKTMRDNPFGFLLEPESTSIPFNYREALRPLLQTYLTCAAKQELIELAQELLNESERQTIDFLMLLAQTVLHRVALKKRPRGDPRSPEQTLTLGHGACRDLAVLYVGVCRTVGIATRLVSGYARQPAAGPPELHAWCEVYLPGGGWRGFDPSTGLAVDSGYLALAAGPTHHEVRPTWGTYRGSARCRLKKRIQLEIL